MEIKQKSLGESIPKPMSATVTVIFQLEKKCLLNIYLKMTKSFFKHETCSERPGKWENIEFSFKRVQEEMPTSVSMHGRSEDRCRTNHQVPADMQPNYGAKITSCVGVDF